MSGRESFLFSAFRIAGQWAAPLALFALLAGCTSRRDEFISGRALDGCNGNWPVCSTVVGCLIGAQSFIEGRFPSTERFAITVPEPSSVYVSVFLENVTAAGEYAAITWWEDSCRSSYREQVPGKDFVGETERLGYFERKDALTGVGDHLIEVMSKGEADFVIKVDVIPTRLERQVTSAPEPQPP